MQRAERAANLQHTLRRRFSHGLSLGLRWIAQRLLQNALVHEVVEPVVHLVVDLVTAVLLGMTLLVQFTSLLVSCEQAMKAVWKLIKTFILSVMNGVLSFLSLLSFTERDRQAISQAVFSYVLNTAFVYLVYHIDQQIYTIYFENYLYIKFGVLHVLISLLTSILEDAHVRLQGRDTDNNIPNITPNEPATPFLPGMNQGVETNHNHENQRPRAPTPFFSFFFMLYQSMVLVLLPVLFYSLQHSVFIASAAYQGTQVHHTQIGDELGIGNHETGLRSNSLDMLWQLNRGPQQCWVVVLLLLRCNIDGFFHGLYLILHHHCYGVLPPENTSDASNNNTANLGANSYLFYMVEVVKFTFWNTVTLAYITMFAADVKSLFRTSAAAAELPSAGTAANVTEAMSTPVQVLFSNLTSSLDTNQQVITTQFRSFLYRKRIVLTLVALQQLLDILAPARLLVIKRTHDHYLQKAFHRITPEELERLQQSEDGKCAICLCEHLAAGENGSVRLSCGHVFHVQCVQRLLQSTVNAQSRTSRLTAQHRCPICRKDIFVDGPLAVNHSRTMHHELRLGADDDLAADHRPANEIIREVVQLQILNPGLHRQQQGPPRRSNNNNNNNNNTATLGRALGGTTGLLGAQGSTDGRLFVRRRHRGDAFTTNRTATATTSAASLLPAQRSSSSAAHVVQLPIRYIEVQLEQSGDAPLRLSDTALQNIIQGVVAAIQQEQQQLATPQTDAVPVNDSNSNDTVVGAVHNNPADSAMAVEVESVDDNDDEEDEEDAMSSSESIGEVDEEDTAAMQQEQVGEEDARPQMVRRSKKRSRLEAPPSTADPLPVSTTATTNDHNAITVEEAIEIVESSPQRRRLQ